MRTRRAVGNRKPKDPRSNSIIVWRSMTSADFLAKRWLEHDLCAPRGLGRIPTGEPLRKLRCSDSEIERLKRLLRTHLPDSVPCTSPHLSAVFCLFAAEVLRRGYAGGAWSWDTVGNALGLPLDHGVARELTKHGLERIWRRRILKDLRGNQYLRTLIVEGGIPSYLIRTDRGQFAAFLRALQRDLDRFTVATVDGAITVAQQRAYLLPASWQNADVFALSAELLLEVRPLRELVPPNLPASQVIDWLDAHRSGWRDALSLSLNDEAARQLVAGLVSQRPSGQQRRLDAFCRRVLIRKDGEWQAAVAFDFDGQIRRDASWSMTLTASDPPNRAYLVPVGHLADHIQGKLALFERYSDGQWRVRSLQERSLVFGVPLNASLEGVLSIGGDERERVRLPGGEPLADVPWIFEDDEEDTGEPERLKYIGSGTCRTNKARLFLASEPNSGELEPVGDGRVRSLGPIQGTSRILYEITGGALYKEAGDDKLVRLQPAAARSVSQSVGFDLRRPSWRVQAPLVSLGPPGSRILRAVGSPSERPILHWRPAGGQHARWRRITSDAEWPIGQVDLALIHNDVIWDRTRLVILPAGARISARPGARGTCIVECIGFGDALIAFDSMREDGLKVEKRSIPGGIQFQLYPPVSAPAELVIVTRFGNPPCDLRHFLPFPRAGGGFVDPNTRWLPANTAIHFDALTGNRARVGAGTERQGTLQIDLRPTTGPFATIQVGLDIGFFDEFPLSRSRPTLASLFAMAADLDAEFHCTVLTAGQTSRPLRIVRFLNWLDFDVANCLARIRSRIGGLYENADDVNLYARRLSDPAGEPTILTCAGPNTWKLPGQERSGAWLIYGCRGNAFVIRPRLWISGERLSTIDDGADLSSIAGVSDRQVREQAFDRRFEKLAADPWAPSSESDWGLIDTTIETYRNVVPLAALDALLALARQPDALATWAFRLARDRLPLMLILEEELPFTWVLVPLNAWLRAARKLQKFWAANGLDKDLITRLMGDKLDDLKSFCPSLVACVWYLREALNLPSISGEATLRQLRTPAFQSVLRSQIGNTPSPQQWLAAARTNANWRNLDHLMLAGAAVYAAEMAVTDQRVTPDVSNIIRYCRERDRDQFDFRYQAAVSLRRGQLT
jgi:hypothetical protein